MERGSMTPLLPDGQALTPSPKKALGLHRIIMPKIIRSEILTRMEWIHK